MRHTMLIASVLLFCVPVVALAIPPRDKGNQKGKPATPSVNSSSKSKPDRLTAPPIGTPSLSPAKSSGQKRPSLSSGGASSWTPPKGNVSRKPVSMLPSQAPSTQTSRPSLSSGVTAIKKPPLVSTQPVFPSRPPVGTTNPSRPSKPAIPTTPNLPNRPSLGQTPSGSKKPIVNVPSQSGGGGMPSSRPTYSFSKGNYGSSRPINTRPDVVQSRPDVNILRPQVNNTTVQQSNTINQNFITRNVTNNNITNNTVVNNTTIDRSRNNYDYSDNRYSNNYGRGGYRNDGYRDPYRQLHYHWQPSTWAGSYRPAYSYTYSNYSTGGASWMTISGTGPMFVNPYFVRPTTSTVIFDYSRPIVLRRPDYADSTADLIRSEQAIKRFDEARLLFRRGQYAAANVLIDDAIRLLPDDPTLHQFRALVLFARGEYHEAAEVLYSVLAVSQGWDGATVAKLYDSVDLYFLQSQSLEQALFDNKEDYALRFLLAYHYVLQGNFHDAKGLLTTLYVANPNDEVVKNFLLAVRNS
ncbi:hypothetical protein LOC68_09935 [Blastopirellula sp. JC732]|uniref:Tetratricopeptide repeat protein n=1 Tax=Blastopirellula sediminis TaxID=2894196 RepID=A0A9X1MKC1_9BACT|nr:hypothetical protein [Blastopirellula sediminis]MCC9608505.1 hypothetical protein [Blastopirellula sediminis]MCC9628718.1 hypothetical protein [Blastopirellula sediminis]